MLLSVLPCSQVVRQWTLTPSLVSSNLTRATIYLYLCGDCMKKIIDKLIELNKTISTMESCTGGAIVNEITNIEGASEVLKYSAVTYSNEFKIKMGVDESLIKKYSVYSVEVAKDMSKVISYYTLSDYGVGITGKLNRYDKNNLYGDDNIVYVSIYDRNEDIYYTEKILVTDIDREKNKEIVVNKVESMLLEIIK